MKIIADRIRLLREGVKLSQARIASLAGTQQTSINRYETDRYEPPLRFLIWYADYFDVSLDYLCGRTDNPQGRLYNYEPKAIKINEENSENMKRFINMCFDSSSPVSAKMKEAMMNIFMDGADGQNK